MNGDRVNPFGDLTDFSPTSNKEKTASSLVDKNVIEQVAADNGFPSRQAAKVAPKSQQRRRRTGRNQQINIKATAETIDRLNRMADELGVPLGEVLERALEALGKAI